MDIILPLLSSDLSLASRVCSVLTVLAPALSFSFLSAARSPGDAATPQLTVLCSAEVEMHFHLNEILFNSQ